MLNMINVELELISDADINLFAEKDLTGKFSYISLRDVVRPTVSIWNVMTQNKNQNRLYT